MAEALFVEIESSQMMRHSEHICGDHFLSRRIAAEARSISVLSDGLGSGVKASILSTMTATMALKFMAEDSDLIPAAETIMDALPTCRVRKISYSTFTIVDARLGAQVRIIEMDNPPFVLVRQGSAIEVPHEAVVSPRHQSRAMRVSAFHAEPGDRIVLVSDGITQSGLGTPNYPLGWRDRGLREFVLAQVNSELDLSARELSRRILREGLKKEPGWHAQDDMTAAVIYFRRPRRTLVLSGPPVDRNRDRELANQFRAYSGRKVICGGTTANIVSRELGRSIRSDLRSGDREIPPLSLMEGVDLVTEGILTMTRTLQLLEGGLEAVGRNAAVLLADVLRESDVIEFVVGTRINEAHQDPSLPVELEIRRNIIKGLSKVLRERFLKEVSVRYV